MSVMLERPVAVACPCTPDCRERHAGCHVACERYQPYRRAKEAAYRQRQADARAALDATAGKRKAAAKRFRWEHKHGK